MQIEEKKVNEVRRGEVYFYSFPKTEGSEQSGRRPCIIVSNDKNNEHAPTVTVVPLTTKEKSPLPTHVYINIGSVYGTALTEQIMTISKFRLCEYCGEISAKMQKEIDKALAVQFSLNTKTSRSEDKEDKKQNVPVEPVQPTKEEEDKTDKKSMLFEFVERERNVYKELYEELLKKCLES